jgi:hypothetical protein
MLKVMLFLKITISSKVKFVYRKKYNKIIKVQSLYNVQPNKSNYNLLQCLQK